MRVCALALPTILLTAAMHATLRVQAYVCRANESHQPERFKFGPGHFHVSRSGNLCNQNGTTCRTRTRQPPGQSRTNAAAAPATMTLRNSQSWNAGRFISAFSDR